MKLETNQTLSLAGAVYPAHSFNFTDKRESEEKALGAQFKIKNRRDGIFSKVRTSTHHPAEDEPISAFSCLSKTGLFR